MDLQLNNNTDAKKAYETPRLEAYGDATSIAKSLDVHKMDEVDIAANGSVVPAANP